MASNKVNKYDPYSYYSSYLNSGLNGSDAENDPFDLKGKGDDHIGGGLANLSPTYSENALQANSLFGIFGAPYQFLPNVDRRVYANDGALGRKYAEKIMMHAPLLMLTPCRQKFMEGFNAREQNKILANLVESGVRDVGGGLKADTDKVGRYYTTSFAYDEYYNCVRIMCKEVAHFLGIDNVEINYNGKKKQKLGDLDWMANKNEGFSKYFAAKESVVFYADGLVSLSDSFSNNTTDSSIASSINSYSDQAKELRFLTGGSGLTGLIDSTRDSISNATSALSALGGQLTAGMLGDLASTGVSTIMTGGKLIFPKIWGDSSNSRSYSFDIKLRSPDHDSVSIFLNVLVPYIHLLAFCLPQSLTSGTAAQSPNAYDTPFLLRAYCKGMFNINMGIITDLSATRGAESQWNDQGLPTQIDVSISIDDMYSSLVMTNPKKDSGDKIKDIWNTHFDVVTNTEMIDYLCNLSGLNVAAESLVRRGDIFKTLTLSRLSWIPSQTYHYFENGVSNVIRRAHDRLR